MKRTAQRNSISNSDLLHSGLTSWCDILMGCLPAYLDVMHRAFSTPEFLSTEYSKTIFRNARKAQSCGRGADMLPACLQVLPWLEVRPHKASRAHPSAVHSPSNSSVLKLGRKEELLIVGRI